MTSSASASDDCTSLSLLPIQSPEFTDPPFNLNSDSQKQGSPWPLVVDWRATESEVTSRFSSYGLPMSHGLLDYWVGFQTKNSNRFSRAFGPNGRYFDFSTGDQGVGGKQLERYIESLRRAMPDSGFDVRHLTINPQGTFAVLEYVWRGHWSGIIPGIMKEPVQNRVIYLPGVDIILIDPISHRLMSVRGYQDKYDFIQQISCDKTQVMSQNKPLMATTKRAKL